MDYWSVEKKDINLLAITPTLQYSNTPKLMEIESSHDRLSSFGVLIRNSITRGVKWQLIKNR
jgi:hypothetical protein